MKHVHAAITASALVLLLTAPTTQAGHEQSEVVTDVISHEDTQDIHVWAPATEGTYPVVYALHGTGGFGADWDVVGSMLAQNGVVVFATDYRSTDAAIGRFDRIIADLECGYRYVREMSAEYGGDLDQPVVNLGHSLGAEMGLGGALDDRMLVPGGTYDKCFSGAQRPDAIVGVGGCYYEYDGRQFPFDAANYGAGDATIVLVSGDGDETCPSWQSEDATKAFTAAGHEVTHIEIPGATHLTLIGKDFVDEEWRTLPDHPAAAAVVQVVLDTIESLPAE